jgi:hypothetical protein
MTEHRRRLRLGVELRHAFAIPHAAAVALDHQYGPHGWSSLL